MWVGIHTRLMYGGELTGEGGSHIGSHDVPVVVMILVAVLAEEKDSINSAGL